MRGEKFAKRMQETINGNCDKKCSKCQIYLSNSDLCLWEANKLWEKWKEEQHKKLSEKIRGVKNEL